MQFNSIYLVLDMINDLVHEQGPNGKVGYGPILAKRNTIANTVTALRKARLAGIKVGYVRIGFSQDYRECPETSKLFQGVKKAGLFKLGTWGTEVHAALKPDPGDYDIVKHRVSPFYATSLDTILGANDIRRIYISGVSTSGAVLSAAKEGHDRDYEMIVLEDCCCALTDEQHLCVIELMQRMTAITNSAEVQFY